MQEKIISDKLKSLSFSKFRSSFHLKKKDIVYLENIGYKKLVSHTYDFIINRLSKKDILNDGAQTPMKGHPVFIAQHATATCCRTCLEKWHGIEKNRDLTNQEINYVVMLILKWITKEYERRTNEKR